MIGFDYTARIAPVDLLAAGCAVAFRYITRSDWPKSIAKPEADELHAAGIPIVCNFESTADRMLGAAAAGHADAVEARGHMDALGIPQGVTIWFSADWDVQPAEVVLAMDYLYAAAQVLGSKSLVGCYGGWRMVQAAADAGFGIWQTVAWSGGRWDPRAAARQTGEQRNVGGVVVDVNDILIPNALGAWTPGGTSMGTISPAIGQRWPELAGDFPANGTFDNDTALIWSDAGARAAALYSRESLELERANASKLDQLLGRVVPVVDAQALAAAVVAGVIPHLPATVDPVAFADAVATAVSTHVTGQAVDYQILADTVAHALGTKLAS